MTAFATAVAHLKAKQVKKKKNHNMSNKYTRSAIISHGILNLLSLSFNFQSNTHWRKLNTEVYKVTPRALNSPPQC